METPMTRRDEITRLTAMTIAAAGFFALFVGAVLALGAFLGGNAPMLHGALITAGAGGVVYLVGMVIWWRR
jgi:zinc transporter ZupT